MMVISSAGPMDHVAWDDYVRSFPSGSFLQSWNWGEFQGRAGFPIHRLLLRKEGETDLRAVCLLVEKKFPFGQRMLYAPWGPVYDETRSLSELHDIMSEIRKYVLRTFRPMSYRVEPRVEFTESHERLLRNAGFTPIHHSIQPRQTLLLSLVKHEDDLLREMHPKTRYNIRIATRHGVIVREETTPAGIEKFFALSREVEKRGTFRFHPREYYRQMVDVLDRAKMLHLFIAEHHGDPLAAGILIHFGTELTYAHGASSGRKKHVMAPHLLHWEIMQWAKSQGVETYDFFGIAPDRESSHPWAGISRFKRGFGGVEHRYVGAADAVRDPIRYQFFRTARGIRDLLR